MQFMKFFYLSICCFLALSLSSVADPSEEWHSYGQDPAGSRFSTLDQINRSNVTQLERAWTYRTGDIASKGRHYAECTPLVIDGVVYVITPFSRLIAIDAVTGKELWRFSPEPMLNHSETGAGGLASRGLTYWSSGDARRILLPVRDGRLYSIDLNTHVPDPDFGEQGYIDYRAGLADGGEYLFLSSPPAIYDNVILQPYGVNDTSSDLLHYVPLRAYDVRSGELLWTFDTIPQPGEPGHETWEGDSWANRSGCNPWAPISVDSKHGLFFVPVGAPNNDKYGGDRHGDNLYGNAIVALDARTGKRRWHFQTIHHDLWDYDPAALPNLVDLTIDGKTVPAVAAPGKTGFVYVLNRLTGEPIFPIVERSVPESDVKGEKAAATQPFPTKPPAFSKQSFSVNDLRSINPEADAALRKRFEGYRNEGLYTPPSTQGTVVNPGQLGGSNWSGASVTPDGFMYITGNELAYITSIRSMDGPYGARPSAGHFRAADGHPAIKPPWGTLTKLDLNKGTLIWQEPLGDVDELSPGDAPDTGTMNFGGATTTAGGLVFVAASTDAKFRAYDATSGKVLYETQLEAAGYGAPVTYQGNDGHQYVVLFAGGGGKAKSAIGDYVVSYRLKR